MRGEQFQFGARQGYHGTVFDFTDKVLPADAHQQGKNYQISGGDLTYFHPRSANPDVDRATERSVWRSWGTTTYRRDLRPGTNDGRPRVHITEPEGEQWADRNLMDRSFSLDYRRKDSPVKARNPKPEWQYNGGRGGRDWVPNAYRETGRAARVSPSQRIVDTLWAPPPAKGEVVQQTFPHENWNKYSIWGHTGQANWKVDSPLKGEQWRRQYDNPDGEPAPKPRKSLSMMGFGQRSLLEEEAK